MSYQVLARKYRPRTFAELVGQDHVVRTLTNAIQTGRIAHAFLFVGPRGIGKTSIARILAKALNCPGGPKVDFDPDDEVCREIAEGRSLDVIEIDGASNNSVDQIRELNEAVRFAPARGQFKIYYIDEVHMLSIGAFNALLKTLEEPPAHAKFIFATTEAHKLPATIVSRCQRFDLKRITDADLARQLKMIAGKEGIEVSDAALRLLARNAEGGMRDAESAFDQLISFCGQRIEEDDVLRIFGLTGSREVWDLAEAVQAGDADLALRRVRELTGQGKDLVRLTQELLRYHRNLLLHAVSPEMARAELDPDEVHHFTSIDPVPPRDLLLAWIDELVQLEERIRFALVKEVLFEITVIRLTEQRQKISLEAVIRHLTGHSPNTQAPSPSAPAAPPPARSTAPVAAPAIPEPVPAPAPAGRPATAPAPDPAQAAPPASAVPDPAAAWQRLRDNVASSRDLILRRAADALEFLGRDGNAVRLKMTASAAMLQAFPDSPSIQSLRDEVRKAFGPQAVLDLAYAEVAPPPSAEGAATDTPTPTTGKGLDKADFENDPLIREALKTFEARIATIKDT